jgi:hypothetical protein
MAATGMAAGLMAGALCIWLNQRARREIARLRAELDRVRVDGLAEIGCVRKEFAAWQVESQASAEFCEGRLSAAGRSRAMRMLRAGIAPETAAVELGMARSEVRLLKEVAGALVGRGS